MQPLFFQPGKTDWTTFEMIRSLGNRGENTPGLNANTDGAYAIGTERNTEIHVFQVRNGLDPQVATIQWEMLSRAAYSVAIPFYSALITEVSPYFSDQTVSFDHCKETDIVNNEEPENSINYVLMDISSLCFENPDTLGISVRSYLMHSRTSSSNRTRKSTPPCWPRRPPKPHRSGQQGRQGCHREHLRQVQGPAPGDARLSEGRKL